jgi:hypothetical protein
MVTAEAALAEGAFAEVNSHGASDDEQLLSTKKEKQVLFNFGGLDASWFAG